MIDIHFFSGKMIEIQGKKKIGKKNKNVGGVLGKTRHVRDMLRKKKRGEKWLGLTHPSRAIDFVSKTH